MSILDAQILRVGLDGQPPFQVYFNTDDTLAEVLTAGYLGSGAYLSFSLSENDIAVVTTSDNLPVVLNVVETNGVFSFQPLPGGLTTLPATVGNFAVFATATGLLKDLGYLPSNAAKTKVVMAAGATIVNYIAKYADTAGTIGPVGQALGDAYNLGDIHAGVSGILGKMISHAPTTSKGTLVLQAGNNAADYSVSIINRSHAQNSSRNIPDIGADADFLLTTLASPDANANLIAFDITVGQAALAAGASVTLYASSGTKQYKIRSLFVNSNGTNFSGGGGDRLLSITDNTTVYSLIPAASLGTLANTAWGVTELPFPASAAINTSTAAGASIVAKYSGGAADYTAGSVVISGILQRVA